MWRSVDVRQDPWGSYRIGQDLWSCCRGGGRELLNSGKVTDPAAVAADASFTTARFPASFSTRTQQHHGSDVLAGKKVRRTILCPFLELRRSFSYSTMYYFSANVDY
jgi:hypothetical protein